MAEEQEILRLEALCQQFYESSDSAERKQAEEALLNFAKSPDCLPKCQLLLERKASSCAQFLAASIITNLITRNPNGLSLEQRLEIRNYILNYLATNTKLDSCVFQTLVKLFARLTKIGWLECTKDKEFVFREITQHITSFLQGNAEFCNIGVQLMSNLVLEMSQPNLQDANRSLFKHRKIVLSFLDKKLFEFFQLSQDLLNHALKSLMSISKILDDDQQTLISNLLKLTINCLSFDFTGTSSDDCSDNFSSLQIPNNWQPIFLNANTLKLYFGLFHLLPSHLSSLSLSCLVQLASVRREIFKNDTERCTFLNNLITGIRCILENPQGLTDPSSYHQFCRLLDCLKANYQLGELVKADEYSKTLELIVNFTRQRLSTNVDYNSIYYLLNFWKKLAFSAPYIKAEEPHLLERFAPEVTRAYITSRLDLVNEAVVNGLDPFEEEELVIIQQQLEQLSTIAGCEYETTCTLLVTLFDQTAKIYKELMQTSILNSQTQIDIEIHQNRLTWLVYIIGAVIGRVPLNSSNDQQDHMNGELACRVLQLMNYTDMRLLQGGFCKNLELAFLSFLEQFRKTYDQVHMTSTVYKRLSEVFAFPKETVVLNVFVRKIITNLKYWTNNEPIIMKTLQLLNDLSFGQYNSRQIVQLDEIQFILNDHTAQNFPFLSNSIDNISAMKCRTIFYTALGRFLMIDSGEDEDKFEKFEKLMQPFTDLLDTLSSMLNNKTMFSQEETKRAIIGIARDLRGLVCSFDLMENMAMLFDWIYPAYTPVFHTAIDLWYHDPQVTTPILKLYVELVDNRFQRLQFDISSTNSLLLFRDVSKLLVNYGTKMLMIGSDNFTTDQLYPLKLKGISLCFSILKLALSGAYINFGVFQLYGDSALDNALNTAIKLIQSISTSNILEYPKLSQSYNGFLRSLTVNQMIWLDTLEPTAFCYILATITEGLSKTLDTVQVAFYYSILDHIVSYIFNAISKQNKKKEFNADAVPTCIEIVKQQPEILQQMLCTILNSIMSEDCRDQWSMSRPLLALILLNGEYFNQLRQYIISRQPLEKQATMNQLFDGLMNGIEWNLISKNKDRFTQNVSTFRKDWRNFQKTTVNSSNSNGN